MSVNEEFKELKKVVREAKPITIQDVRKILDQYFNESLTWSLLKDEWVNLDETQRTALCDRLLSESMDTTNFLLNK